MTRMYRITYVNPDGEPEGSFVVNTDRLPDHNEIMAFINEALPDRVLGGWYTMEGNPSDKAEMNPMEEQ